jgi:hypothetical protein
MAVSQSEGREAEWRAMLDGPDRASQMRALTEIGRLAVTTAGASARRGPTGEGAVRTGGAPGRIGTEALRNAVVHKAASTEGDVRAEAILALGAWSDDTSMRVVKQALRDPDAKVRLAAVHSLTVSSPTECEALLLEVASGDADELVRAQAIVGLSSIEHRDGVSLSDITLGPVRTRGRAGPVPQQSSRHALDAIATDDKSAYVRFLAGVPGHKAGVQRMEDGNA